MIFEFFSGLRFGSLFMFRFWGSFGGQCVAWSVVFFKYFFLIVHIICGLFSCLSYPRGCVRKHEHRLKVCLCVCVLCALSLEQSWIVPCLWGIVKSSAVQHTFVVLPHIAFDLYLSLLAVRRLFDIFVRFIFLLHCLSYSL